jgi:methylenetetrahydrofolate dehydrogenase (NADP+)/methenyltetrahydrofolate cyclohydrolase
MTKSNIIDGKEIAASVIEQVKIDLNSLKNKGIEPCLAVIIVGNDPASKIYVARKKHMAMKIGIKSFVFELDKNVTTETVVSTIIQLNNDQTVHGILIQLPLPTQIDTTIVINSINPKKDVDGFTIENVGKLVTNQDGLVPCTPQGCLHLIKSVEKNIQGLHSVVIGRSNIVGRPMASLLLHENCTVTTIHSKTINPREISKTADILVVATGIPNLVDQEWVKKGCIVIDVGISRISKNGVEKLVGDVNFEEVKKIARAITPVPGGVGPMTISYLLKNTLKAAYHYTEN